MEITEGYFPEVMGAKTRYLTKGKGKVLILISGWGGNADNFIPMMQEIPDNYQCIAIDLPGFGSSSPFVHYRHTVENYAHYLHELTQKNGIVDFVPVGISLGATVILHYLADFPSSVKRAVIQSPVFEPIELYGQVRFLYDLFFRNERSIRAVRTIIKLSANPLVQRVVYFLGDANIKSLDWDFFEKYIIPHIKFTDAKAAVESVDDVLSVHIVDKIRVINSQVLLAYGTRENLYPESYILKFASLIRKCQIERFDGGSHFAMLQMHRQFAKAIVDFVSS